MSITGNLTEVKLLDLIQLICTERDTARLRARNGSDEASLYIAGGEIVHARLGASTGPEALYGALAWESGTFELEKGVRTEERTIDDKWAPLLLEGLARIEAQRVDLGLAPGRPVDTQAAGDRDVSLGPLLEALPGVEEVVIISRDGLGLSYASSSRSEDEGALAAFVALSAEEIGEALALGELREIRMVLAGERHVVLPGDGSYVGFRIAPRDGLREIVATASKLIARGS